MTATRDRDLPDASGEPGVADRRPDTRSGAVEPRERNATPSNFVSAAQVVEKVANLHGRLVAVLDDQCSAAPSERAKLLLESWLADEKKVSVTLAERIAELDLEAKSAGDAPADRDSNGYGAVVQYAQLDAFEEAVAHLETARFEDAEHALDHAERVSGLLIRALRQLAERVEHSEAQDLFRSLADLEEGNAKRRSDDENAALTL